MVLEAPRETVAGGLLNTVVCVTTGSLPAGLPEPVLSCQSPVLRERRQRNLMNGCLQSEAHSQPEVVRPPEEESPCPRCQ